MTLLIVGVWVAAGVFVGCRIATLLAWRMMRVGKFRYPNLNGGQQEPTGEQWFGASFVGLFFGVLWPLSALAFAFRRLLFKPPADVIRERQRREIERLERELNLR